MLLKSGLKKGHKLNTFWKGNYISVDVCWEITCTKKQQDELLPIFMDGCWILESN